MPSPRELLDTLRPMAERASSTNTPYLDASTATSRWLLALDEAWPAIEAILVQHDAMREALDAWHDYARKAISAGHITSHPGNEIPWGLRDAALRDERRIDNPDSPNL